MKKPLRQIRKNTNIEAMEDGLLIKSTKKESLETRKGMSLIDQFSFIPTQYGKGRQKPSRLTGFDLRNLANNNSLVRICINRIKHQTTKVDYVIRPKDPKKEDQVQDQIKYVEMLLQYPNSNDDTYRTLLSKLIEDILILDQGYIEKVRNPKGWIKELYHIDGNTIKPNIDDFGLYKSPAFYQFVSFGTQEPDAEFEANEILQFMVNPQGQSGKTGYGLSPVEAIASTVVASIQAALYNNNYFDDARIPPAIVNLPNVPTQDLVAFKTAFEAQLAGKPWSNAYTNANGKVDYKLLRPSNQEMQFYELNLWLARIIFAAFEISPEDLGFTMDINKATAQVQERLSKQNGIGNMLDVIKEEINADLIGDLAQYDDKFNEIEFAFDDQDKLDEATQSQTDQIYIQNGVITPNEVRIRMGLDPLEAEEPIKQPVPEKVNQEIQPNQNPEETTKTFKSIDKWIKFLQ